ncbi:hypothetical protein [uncultured Shewanella sp.]|uniref:hypothetical protein n=1 Tax=uncultured Shewanella sp. TaxID=173975 RepID=UPI00261F749D|nr:hypothetical protein [uncultured Shewanella sp.]
MEISIEKAVEIKMDKQNGVAASIGLAIWAVPYLLLWILAFYKLPYLAAIMIPLTGAWTGLLLRFHGRGLEGKFNYIAYTSFILIMLFAASLGILIEGPVLIIVVLVLMVAGLLCISYVSQISLPKEEYKIFSRMMYSENSSMKKRYRNHFFIVLPTVILSHFVSFALVLVCIGFLNEYLNIALLGL